jgi:hypothetical protein
MLKHSKWLAGIAAGAAVALAAGPAFADKIKHPVAIFAGLDKITGRIISFEVNIDETVQFGSLHVTPRVCYTRPPTEAPHTTGFVEVEEIEKENQFKKIFTGWMFAASPGLSAAEHPVYDVWLTDCKGGSEIIREARQVEDTPADPGRTSPECTAGGRHGQACRPRRTASGPRSTTEPQRRTGGASGATCAAAGRRARSATAAVSGRSRRSGRRRRRRSRNRNSGRRSRAARPASRSSRPALPRRAATTSSRVIEGARPGRLTPGPSAPYARGGTGRG